MQPVQECLCRAVLFQGFVVTSIWDAYHISLLLKRIIVKTQGRFLWRWQSGAVVRASDFGPRGPWFEPRPVLISLWP